MRLQFPNGSFLRWKTCYTERAEVFVPPPCPSFAAQTERRTGLRRGILIKGKHAVLSPVGHKGRRPGRERRSSWGTARLPNRKKANAMNAPRGGRALKGPRKGPISRLWGFRLLLIVPINL